MKLVSGATIRTPEYNNSLPERTAHVGNFRIDVTEVTEAQYAAFLIATGYIAPSSWGGQVADRKKSNLPVTQVSFVDAMFYCAWRKTRLPTAHEWHLAAFGAKGHREPWGAELPEAAMARGDKLSPVGVHPRSAGPYGLADIVGNAWEWCFSPLVTGEPGKVDLKLAVALGGGALRLQGSDKTVDSTQAIIQTLTGDHNSLLVFWDAREGLPYAGPNITLWGASVLSDDFLCFSGGGTFWFGTPETAARRYPRLCEVAADFSLRSPTIGFRCAANEAVTPRTKP